MARPRKPEDPQRWPVKCARLVERFGFDAAIDYRGKDEAALSAAIAAAVIYAGRSKKKKPVDKLAAAEKTPPTD